MSTSRIKATLSLLQKQKPRWPDPELSIGKFRGIKKGKYNCWEAEGPAKEAFEEIKPRIKLLLEELCGPVPSSSFVLFDIFMIGETQSTAVPHIMFSCKHQKSRKAAVKVVEQSDVLQQCPPGIHFGHWDYPPHLKDLRFLSSSMSSSFSPRLIDASRHDYDIIPILDPYKPQTVRAMQLRVRKTCGASETYSKATIGGVVELSGKRFYMAPAHVFSNDAQNPPSDGIGLDSDDSDCEFGGFDDLNDNTADDREAEFTSQYSVTPESSDVEDEWDFDDEHLPDVDSEGSSPEENGIQSAIVSDSKEAWCLPSKAEIITPSSSATVHDSMKLNTLDYYLLEIDDGDKFSLDLPVLSERTVGRPGAGAINVTAVTGSSTLLAGVLSDRRTCIRLPHTTGYIEVLTVEFQQSLRPGDSGSVVRDASTGLIYGHVVAGDTGSQTAFIIPADDMLDDLMANTGDNRTLTVNYNMVPQLSLTPKEQTLSFPVLARLPVPTMEGFKAQITQLNPRLEPALMKKPSSSESFREWSLGSLSGSSIRKISQLFRNAVQRLSQRLQWSSKERPSRESWNLEPTRPRSFIASFPFSHATPRHRPCFTYAVEVRLHNDGPSRRQYMHASLNTECEYNLMSSRMWDRLVDGRQLQLEPCTSIIFPLDSAPLVVQGMARGVNWHLLHGPATYVSDFLVIEMECFDLLIGSATISRENLLTYRGDLSFRRSRDSTD